MRASEEPCTPLGADFSIWRHYSSFKSREGEIESEIW
jgi:hypothetical protein